MLARFLVAVICLLPAGAWAEDIDCRNTSSRMEASICADEELLTRERAIEAWAAREIGDKSRPLERVLAKQSAKYHDDCDIDRACIAWFQSSQALQLKALTQKQFELPPFSDRRDPFLLYFDDYARMRVTILRREGLDTEKAVITARHTNREVCLDTVVTPSTQCIHEEDLRPLLTFSANCREGMLHTLYGFERKVTRRDFDAVAIMDVEANTDLAVTDPDSYKRDLAQFNALCPNGL